MSSVSLKIVFIIFRLDQKSEIWRYITYMFVHVDYSHIVFNVLMQVFVGVPLEMSHGPIRVGSLYLIGVIAASLTVSVICDPSSLAGMYIMSNYIYKNIYINYTLPPKNLPILRE